MENQKAIAKKNSAIIWRNRRNAYLFLLPNFVGFVVFTMIPVVTALIYSFTNYDGNSQMSFVGFRNYIKLFNDSSFLISLKIHCFIPLEPCR